MKRVQGQRTELTMQNADFQISVEQLKIVHLNFTHFCRQEKCDSWLCTSEWADQHLAVRLNAQIWITVTKYVNTVTYKICMCENTYILQLYIPVLNAYLAPGDQIGSVFTGTIFSTSNSFHSVKCPRLSRSINR